MLEEYSDLIIIFLSILIEALPFVLIGVAISAVIHLYLSEDLVKRLLPRNRLLGLLPAALMGLIFPLCECGNVLIARRLVGKGVPLHLAITFMIAAPVINPVTIFSTYMAFPNMPQMVYYRVGGAYFVSVAVGIGLYLYLRKRDESKELRPLPEADCGCAAGDEKPRGAWGHLKAVTSHAGEDFFTMGKFLILGAFLAALIQTQVSRDLLVEVGSGRLSSVLVMMVLAYGMSICSEADAFVAASFSGTFRPASLLAFMLYGPMTDIKNTLMMLACFRGRFTLLWLALVTVFVILFVYPA